MQALLSFEQAPPIAAPFRFFLTAPFFSALAGVLLLTNGAEIFSSRWSSAALAATHLITVGFMLQVMIGAMVQILPVVAGANLGRPLLVASVVHGLMVPGALALIAGFLGVSALAFPLAMLLLVAGIGLFLVMAARSLHGVPSTSATIAGFKRALLGLLVVVVIGLALIGGLEGYWSLAMLAVTRMHVAWGLGAWGLGLLSAIAYVVVPMFQITPQYPVWFSRGFGSVLLASVVMASLASLTATEWLLSVLEATIVWMSAGFCAMTLWLQARSKRARPDLTQRFWRLGLSCGLAACLLWGTIRVIPALEPQAEWPLVFGALVLVGGFVSVISGMLYKIVPFLVWLHLQNRGKGKVMAPNMKMVLAESRMARHFYAHLASCGLLVAAPFWPTVLAKFAGLAMIAASALLAANLLSAVAVYRHHARLIDERLASTLAGGGA